MSLLTSDGTLKITVDYEPQAYQAKIHDSTARFKVVVIGRRGGKTKLAMAEVIRRAYESQGLYWFVAPSYRQAKSIGWRMLKSMLKDDENWFFNEQELRAEHRLLETAIELKGADNYDALRGVALNGVVIDEFATMKQDVWPEVIRPMLTDTGGWAMFIGTPRGRNHFYDLFKQKEEGWESWHYPTKVNEFIDPKEIDSARKDLPEKAFAQEYLAEFLEDAATVFRNVKACVKGEFAPPEKGTEYVIGVDLAKHEDWTVLTVLDRKSRHVVHFERFQEVSWPEQKERIQRLHERYNWAEVILDATGVGDPTLDFLNEANVWVTPIKFTNESKRGIVELLQRTIEERLVTFPRIEELIDELGRFAYDRTIDGRLRYSAPAGYHDDCVVSLGLAVWGLRRELHASRVITSRNVQSQYEDRQGMQYEEPDWVKDINREREVDYAGY